MVFSKTVPRLKKNEFWPGIGNGLQESKRPADFSHASFVTKSVITVRSDNP
jgi:hypothetical protein